MLMVDGRPRQKPATTMGMGPKRDGPLRRDAGREDSPRAVHERDGGLVAGSLEREDNGAVLRHRETRRASAGR